MRRVPFISLIGLISLISLIGSKESDEFLGEENKKGCTSFHTELRDKNPKQYATQAECILAGKDLAAVQACRPK